MAEDAAPEEPGSAATRVDFYLLSTATAADTVAVLAGKVRQAEERLLVVADDLALLEACSKALWSASPEAFLANGIAGDEHDARQPILLSDKVAPVNGARYLLVADGRWREPEGRFDRVLFLFDQETIAEARMTWKALQDRDGMTSRFWKQQDGRWVEGP